MSAAHTFDKELEMILTAIIVFLTVVLLIAQPIRIEITALAVIPILALTGLLEPSEALSGFANPAMLSVAAMLALSAGLERAGVADYLSRAIARRAQGSTLKVLLLLAGPTAVLSAFMNNTAIVAIMIPVAMTLSKKLSQPASKILLPISYLSILGGTCTLIGTSTNIIVDGLYRQAGGPGFGMFEFGKLGLIYLLIGGAYVILVVPRSLPHRSSLASLMDLSQPGIFVTEVRIPDGGAFVGRRVQDLLRDEKDIRVLELVRDEEVTLGPAPGTGLQAGDLLIIEGTARAIHELIDQRKVEYGTAVSDAERAPIRRFDLRMVEAVVTPNSHLLHRKVRELGLARRLGILVLAVRRLGRHHQYNLRTLELQSGDVLLLQGEPRALRSLQDEGELLLIEGVERTLTFPRKAPVALGILAAVVGLAAANAAPFVVLAFAGVVAMLAARCLSFAQVTRALDPAVLVLLAGVIPLGLAMEKSGLAATIASSVVDLAGPHGPILLIGTFYLLTSILTEFLSNNAAAALLTPIGVSVAFGLGIDPKPLLVAIAFGASASFATPIGYQTNTMVMGPGGYVFRDYLKAGLPMNIIMAIVATALIPLLWKP